MLDFRLALGEDRASCCPVCWGEECLPESFVCSGMCMQGGWYLGELSGLVQVALLSTQKACPLPVVKAQNLYRNLALSLKFF